MQHPLRFSIGSTDQSVFNNLQFNQRILTRLSIVKVRIGHYDDADYCPNVNLHLVLFILLIKTVRRDIPISGSDKISRRRR